MGVLGAIAAAVKGVKIALIKIAATNTTTPWYQMPISIAGMNIPVWMVLLAALCGGLALGYFLTGKRESIRRY